MNDSSILTINKGKRQEGGPASATRARRVSALKRALPALLTMLALLAALPALAIDPAHYAANSRLASGRWVKVKVERGGMNLITDAQLRGLGFADPSKVHVYGLGGRQLNNGLTEENPDDLPLIPSVRTQKGLVFFAADNITWTPVTKGGPVAYKHTIHPYDDDTWYFVSDAEPGEGAGEMPAAAGVTAEKAATSRTTFTERLLHEKELEPAGDSGSQVWGEDFRSKKSQTFPLTLAGNAGSQATVRVRFASKTVSGTSSLLIYADNKRLPSTQNDNIGESKGSAYGVVTETVKTFDKADQKLDLKIEYSYSGVLYKARLDYIEAFYERSLALEGGELHFYATFHPAEGMTVSGCSAATQIWDVTDPVRPARVDYLLEGDRASFAVTGSGYREFVAFNPESVDRQVAPGAEVANQDLHGLPTPDMLIISFDEYRAGAEQIARVHREHDGFRVHVLHPDQIYNEFSGGKTDVGAFRRLLKMWRDRGEDEEGHAIRYALIMGKAVNDNKGLSNETKSLTFRPMPMWQSYEGLEEAESYSNDAWLGMLDDVADARFMMKTGEMHVPVGRIPCKSGKEALDVAAKIERYVLQPDYGAWRNRVMLIADDDDKGQHLRQAQNCYDAMRGKGSGVAVLYDRNYLDSYSRVMTAVGPTYPQATQRMLDNYNNGVLFTNYIGHASATGWGHERLWEWSSITSMTNERLTFIYAATCGFAYWDNPAVSGAEVLLLNPEAGVIGMIAAARTVYISLNGDLNRATMLDMFARADDGGPLRWGDVFVRGQNRVNDTNSLRYAFIGDPAVRIPGGANSVHVTAIDGREPGDDPTQYPELKAMTTVTVEGEIRRPDGSVDDSFDGTVNLQLFDGERVITTLGQGAQGEVMSYNDRDKRLADTNAPVSGGRWKARLHVPPEILGNYTTAQISCYAWSRDGAEANGSTEKLYVYGTGDAGDDREGPEIEEFYVNHPSLGDGALVSRNVMVFAQLRDKSGINVSQTGIGHSLTLCIDGRDYIDGIGAHFTPDADDPDTGSLSFALNDLEPGEHTLTLTAWDNANNVASASLRIQVGVNVAPAILGISAVSDDDSASVDFRISVDRPNSPLACETGIFDLNGRRLLTQEQTLTSSRESVISTRWDLCDQSGRRVPRGIYIFRCRVETPEGTYSEKSKKIAVGAAETR